MDKIQQNNDNDVFIPAAMLILMTLLIGFIPIPSDPDLWFHLADGQYILSHGEIPQTDPFSFTKQGELWVPHSWLFDVATTLSWHHLGPRTTEAIMAFVFMLTIFVSFCLMTVRGITPLLAAGICIGLAIAAGNTRGIRPQVFSLLICNLTIFLMVRHRYRPSLRLLIFVPLLFLLWAQLHAGCVVGLVVLAVWFGGRAFETLIKREWHQNFRELAILLGTLGLSSLAVLITPHAINHFQYVDLTMGIKELGRTSEWQVPQAFALKVPDIYIYLLIVGVVTLLARRNRRIGWAEIGLCVSLIILALSGIRHIPLACVGAVPLLADILTRHKGYASKRGGTSRKSVLVLAIICIALLVGFWRYPTDIESRYVREEPINGTKALAQLDRPLRVFTTYSTGSFVLFAAHDNAKVFVDSRADVYGDRILKQAYRAMYGYDWEPLFAKWQIDSAVVDRVNPLAAHLHQHPEWNLLAKDISSLTFVKTALQ